MKKIKVSSLNYHLGYLLRVISNTVSQSFARTIEKEDVTVAEWVFLRMLYDIEPISPSQLAKEMRMTKGAISKLCDRLIEKGLVESQIHQNDKRAQTLSLTMIGCKLVPKLAQIADQNDALFFQSLSAKEKNTLQQLLTKMITEQKMIKIPIN